MTFKKIGMITIGQSPRVDIVPEMQEILGTDVEILEAGALDGLTLEEVKSWAKSGNSWLKRADAVSLIVLAKKGCFLQDAFEICDQLLIDGDDMVQKGYGWLLKEASRLHQKEVFDYIVKNRKVMPRTALRYAIELMPKELKAEAMKKD
jgi:3-methyladenine DNA glycosylase AlkD